MRKIRYTGTNAPTAGIILVEIIHRSVEVVLWVGKKAILYAHGTAMRKQHNVEPKDTETEWSKNSR